MSGQVMPVAVQRARRGLGARRGLRRRRRRQSGRHPVPGRAAALRRGACARRRQHRRGRRGGRRARAGPCLGDRRRSAIARRLCALEGRPAKRLSRRRFPPPPSCAPSIVFGPEDDFFNRFAKMAHVGARPAADRRRHDPVPAGLCARCRRSDRARGRESGSPCRQDLRARRPADLQLPRIDDADAGARSAASAASAACPSRSHHCRARCSSRSRSSSRRSPPIR